jgi:hypothetical protein
MFSQADRMQAEVHIVHGVMWTFIGSCSNSSL